MHLLNLQTPNKNILIMILILISLITNEGIYVQTSFLLNVYHVFCTF